MTAAKSVWESLAKMKPADREPYLRRRPKVRSAKELYPYDVTPDEEKTMRKQFNEMVRRWRIGRAMSGERDDD